MELKAKSTPFFKRLKVELIATHNLNYKLDENSKVIDRTRFYKFNTEDQNEHNKCD